MDTLRGNFVDRSGFDEADDYDPADDESGRDMLPPGIGQDERRMQVRAYNHWASLIEDRNFPSIDELEPANLPDFGPYSVLLDFTAGIEDPGISYLGPELAAECGASEEIERLSDVPARSLLSRITDHYMQILANQTPIGFEAEFVNQRGITILYRGILLPFSSDDDTIDFIYGVINWKELADQQSTDELMLEIDQVLDEEEATLPEPEAPETPLADWAEGPVASEPLLAKRGEAVADISAYEDYSDAWPTEIPAPTFGGIAPEQVPQAANEVEEIELEDEIELGAEMELHEEVELEDAPFGNVPGDEPVEQAPPAYTDEPVSIVPQPAEAAMEGTMGLDDWLAAAREQAVAAHASEDRTRNALYEAIGRAYDFSLAAAQAPDEFTDMLADAGLTMQDRAPMTPVVKLVFGADYDKTRLTEYASALTHAHRIGLERGALGEFLRSSEGGLKGVVATERRIRREEAGLPAGPAEAPRERLAKKLRRLTPVEFDTLPAEGKEFALVMIRRTDAGEILVLGEVPDDVALVERAARKLLG